MAIKLSKIVFITCLSPLLLSGCSQAMSNSILSKASTTKTTSKKQTVSLQEMTNYKLDPHHSNARFSINHMKTSTITGGFYEITGDIKFSPKQKSGYAKINIPIDTIHSVSKKFVDHLKGKDFFDSKKYPLATFESTKWHFDDNNNEKVSKVEGKLTMHGKTAPITLTANSFNCYFSPIVKKNVCGGDFTTTIDRTQWGISKYVMMGITKDVVLDIEVEAVKQ